MKSLTLVVIGTGISWVYAVLYCLCVSTSTDVLWSLKWTHDWTWGLNLWPTAPALWWPCAETECYGLECAGDGRWAFFELSTKALLPDAHWLPWGSMSMSSLWAPLQTRYCSYCQLSGSWLLLEWGERHVLLWVETEAAQEQLLVRLVKGEGKGVYSLLMGRRRKASPQASVWETQNNLWIGGFASLPEVVGQSFH